MKTYVVKSLFCIPVLMVLLISCATFTGDIPITAEQPQTEYISPANADGKKDRLVVSADIPDIKGLAVTGWRFTISNTAGNAVYIEEAVAKESTGIRKLFQRSTVSLPPELIWEGKDSSGIFVPDGDYTWRIEAWDKKEHHGTTEAVKVVVDNTPPTGSLSVPFLFFSPNGDGRQDTFSPVHSRFSMEDTWKAVITDESGKPAASYSWAGRPTDISWDGTGKTGKVLPDGVYRYTISSTDRADNTFSTSLDGITIDTAPAAISIKTDRLYFSPNGDGVTDTVTFTPVLESSKDVVETSLTIVDGSGNTLISTSQKNGLVGPQVFEGKDAAGRKVADGVYYAVFSAQFKNGDNPKVSSDGITLDTTPPYIVFSAAYLLFSPDGDGRRDTLTLYQSSSVEKKWEGTINNAAGTTVGRRTWEGKVPPVEWDGKLENGKPAPDGLYSYLVSSTDEAGNSTVRSLQGIRIDTRPTPVTLIPSATAFSPNGDGRTDDVRFHIQPLIPEGMSGWSVLVSNDAGEPVRTFAGGGDAVPDLVTWDGRDEDGDILEGSFTARLEIEYEKGNLGVDITKHPILLDISPPAITADISPLPFSPDGDGYNDVLEMKLDIRDSSPVYSWSVDIIDPYDHPFRTFSATGAPAAGFTVKWNGLSDTGELVQSAEDYTLRITARDTLGNTGSIEKTIPVDILVIRVGDKLKIVISSIYFKPNTADYQSIEPDKAAKNLQTLDRLAEILKKYGAYNISLEGHAVRVYWNRQDRWLAEEKDVLIPLSLERAETIKAALIQRGITSGRMKTAGFGGYQPVVPHSDLDNRWKNRRVEFLLSR